MAEDPCANCGEAIKSGVFGHNVRLKPQQLRIIELALSQTLIDGCSRCADNLLGQAQNEALEKTSALKIDLEQLLKHIPITSINSPFNWRYKTLGLVTAQSVTGTGVFSDVTSAFTDLFGTQSGTYNQKIRSGEDLCRASLLAQAFNLGGNAIVGVDVDYAEVGGQRAMLMVCMTGTAVELHNPEVVDPDLASSMQDLGDKRLVLRDLEGALRGSH